jgi:hypothetical protein
VKCHRTPHAGTVSAEPDEFPCFRIDAQQRRHQRSGPGDHRRAKRSGVAVDQLRVHPRPRVVTIALMPITAGEAWRRARPDHRADRHGPSFERDGKMGSVFPEVAGELHGCGRSLHQDHRDIGRRRAVPLRDALIDERFPHPVRRTPVGDVQRLDPGRVRRRSIIHEIGIELGEQHSGFTTGRAHAVRDDVECGTTEAGAHSSEQELDPCRGDRDTDLAGLAELEGAVIPPQQGESGIQARQGCGGERGHAPILKKRSGSRGADEASVDN